MFANAKWIRTNVNTGDVVPEYCFSWNICPDKKVESAQVKITALGVYEACLNGKRVGEYILAPGWTAYAKRLQVQTYDVSELIGQENSIKVRVGKGWYASSMPGWLENDDKTRRINSRTGFIAEITICFADGEKLVIATDETWKWHESPIRFSEIYDGEVYDATFEDTNLLPCETFDGPSDTLIPQEGEEIREKTIVNAQSVFTTPSGETVVDFGQEVTGYVCFDVDAHKGDEVFLLHGEVLDKEGNFYNANYRSAKAELKYTCCEGKQTWHPELTFYGFRYIKLVSFPGTPEPGQFRAIVVYSDMKQTGSIRTGHMGLNRLISNIFWGQCGNFLDVPTDCPQRDERLGWTGDAEVFCRAASLNYDVERFFIKWLRDMTADQFANGGIPSTIPNYVPDDMPSAAWGDAATICPWTIYQTYGNLNILVEQYPTMKKWVDYITSVATEEHIWKNGTLFADWLGLDAPSGSYKGSSRDDLVSTAFYANSVYLLATAAKLLGKDKDVEEYEKLHEAVVASFRKTFPEYLTQTEHVLAVRFGLCEDTQKTVDALAEMIHNDGLQMMTGFVGTPYILHVLSDYGHADIAWSLLLREKYPSWLYAVGKGATTIWEHWDGIMENGDFWSTDMNSFNHYAYGSVIDWIYEKAAGIRHDDAHPGFTHAIIQPNPDIRIGWMEANLDTRAGHITSRWFYENNSIRYEIETEVPATVIIDNEAKEIAPGSYLFWSRMI